MVLDQDVDPARDHIRGPVDAPYTLVEYGDFECPFCGRATGAVEELRERFGDQLRYVFRHLPLPEVHAHAELAAEAAEAAADAGRLLGDARPAVRAPGCARTRRPRRPRERARTRRGALHAFARLG